MKPGYKQTEVGVIPEEWDDPRLDSLGDGKTPPIKAGPFGSSLTKDQYVPEGYKIYGQEQVIAGDHLFGDYFITLKKYRELETCAVRPGDVLLSLVGTVGRLLEVPEGAAPGIINPRLIRFTFDRERVLPRFFTYVFESGSVQSLLARQAQGGTMGVLNAGVLRPFRISLPPLPEQRAIAEALSDVDGLLGGLDQLIAKKRDLKQAAMQQLLTGKTRLSGFHGNWEVKRLGDVIHLIRGGIYGEEKPRAGLSASSVATTAHIEMDDTWNNKEMPVRYFTAEKLRDYATMEGDLIVVKSSGSAASIQSGKLGFIDSERAEKFVFSNFLMLLRPTAILPRFLYFYLCSHNVKKLLPTLVEASTYPNIRLGDYLAIEIPVPLPDEQTAIAEVLTEIDTELARLEQRREKTRALKQGMMQELLTGRTRLVSAGAVHA